MRKFFILVIPLLSSLFCLGQRVRHYDLDVDIDVKDRSLRVNGYLDIDFQDQDSIPLVLWRNTEIGTISHNGELLSHSFDTISKSPSPYLPNGSSLVLKRPHQGGRTQRIYLSYICDMSHMGIWGNRFTDDWIELGIYSAWYPVNLPSRNFSSELRVSIDDNYMVNGSGSVTQSNGAYNISHRWDIFDNVIIASKYLKRRSFTDKNASVEILYSDFPESDIDTLSYRIVDILDFYTGMFGENDRDDHIKFVLAPGNEGGYSRPKYISYTANAYDSQLLRGIAHEIAHFWWNSANTDTWEDWLNESFANYSYLIYVRERVGKEVYDEIIRDFTAKSNDAPPVWGIQRNAETAHNVLYHKGALILVDFEHKIGKEPFQKLIKEIALNNIGTTKELLDLIGSKLSTGERNWLERQLKE